MKKNFIFVLMSCFLATSALFISGCDDKDDPDNPTSSVSDPEGTILVSMRNWGNGGTSVTPDGCYGSFVIWSDDNFYNPWGYHYKFVTIGAMKGIGNITKIPTSGWADKVSVIPGYGYVGVSYMGNGYREKTTRVTYVRIYVLDYIKSTSGGVIGAEVKYQSPFPAKSDAKEITLSETVINVPYQGYAWNSIPITISPFNANWSVTSSDETWCWPYTNAINSFQVYSSGNAQNTSRTATLTVKVEGLPDKTITVTQAGRN